MDIEVNTLAQIKAETGRDLDNQVDENTLVSGEKSNGTFGVFKLFAAIKNCIDNWITTIAGAKNFTGAVTINSKAVATTEAVNNALTNLSQIRKFRVSGNSGDYASHYVALFYFDMGKIYDSASCSFDITVHSIEHGNNIRGFITCYGQVESNPYVWGETDILLNGKKIFITKTVNNDGSNRITVYAPTYSDNYCWFEVSTQCNKEVIPLSWNISDGVSGITLEPIFATKSDLENYQPKFNYVSSQEIQLDNNASYIICSHHPYDSNYNFYGLVLNYNGAITEFIISNSNTDLPYTKNGTKLNFKGGYWLTRIQKIASSLADN